MIDQVKPRDEKMVTHGVPLSSSGHEEQMPTGSPKNEANERLTGRKTSSSPVEAVSIRFMMLR